MWVQSSQTVKGEQRFEFGEAGVGPTVAAGEGFAIDVELIGWRRHGQLRACGSGRCRRFEKKAGVAEGRLISAQRRDADAETSQPVWLAHAEL